MGTVTDSRSVGRGSAGRGSALLLDHCGRLDRLMDGGRRPGRERLEGLIGPDLAGVLVRALSGDHRLVRPRWADGLREAGWPG
jgi:hypothetical protein